MNAQLQVIRNVRDVVAVLGGPQAAGKRLGKSRQAVQNWIDRGFIAAPARDRVDKALEGRGYIAHPSIYRSDKAQSRRRPN